MDLKLFRLFDTGTPSITKRGWLSLDKEVAPRMTTLTEEPTPLVWLITTPGTLPARPFSTFSWVTLVIEAPSTLPTEYPSDFCSRLIPRAVTTISFNVPTLGANETSITLLPFTGISVVL